MPAGLIFLNYWYIMFAVGLFAFHLWGCMWGTAIWELMNLLGYETTIININEIKDIKRGRGWARDGLWLFISLYVYAMNYLSKGYIVSFKALDKKTGKHTRWRSRVVESPSCPPEEVPLDNTKQTEHRNQTYIYNRNHREKHALHLPRQTIFSFITRREGDEKSKKKGKIKGNPKYQRIPFEAAAKYQRILFGQPLRHYRPLK